MFLGPALGDAESYQGDGTSGIFVSDFQIEKGD